MRPLSTMSSVVRTVELFRTFEQNVAGEQRGYHKPIMVGCVGNISASQVHKKSSLQVRRWFARRAGDADRPRGGAGEHGTGRIRRISTSIPCSEATPRCSARRRRSSIAVGQWAKPIHPFRARRGAGGLSNVAELVHGGGVGGHFELRKIPSEEPGMSPMQSLQRSARALRSPF